VRTRARVAGVVLAAGGSTRLGRPKQLLPFRGEPLVRRAARQALAVCDAVHVVVGADGERVARALDGPGLDVVVNRAWQEGMGGSIATGVRAAIAAVPAVDGLLLLLADQPLVDAGHLGALRARFSSTEGAALAASYGDVVGVPAVFDVGLAAALTVLRADEGARHLLRTLGSRLVAVALPEAAVDVDVEADYEALF
jgi:molybdenum cofactor cytidylyltransferase